jgi:hypothetical protein
MVLEEETMDIEVDPNTSLLEVVRIQARVLIPVLRALRADAGDAGAAGLLDATEPPTRSARVPSG